MVVSYFVSLDKYSVLMIRVHLWNFRILLSSLVFVDQIVFIPCEEVRTSEPLLFSDE